MLAIDETRGRPFGTLRAAYFDASLELLRELAVTNDVDAALPRLSAIVSKMLPHDALRMASFDQRGRPIVNALDRRRARHDGVRRRRGDHRRSPRRGAWRIRGPARDGAAGRRRLPLGPGSVDARAGTPGAGGVLVEAAAGVQPHAPAARASDRVPPRPRRRSWRARQSHPQINDDRAQRIDAGVQRGVDRLQEGTHLRVVGESVEWRGVLRKATQVASTDTTVLITGESGTGKEVVARFIHAASVRKSRPFVALNCAALPEQLLESELFGYERGAFTGAQQAKPGQVELASGGVLFLDEVSEMSLSAQAKFLRVLQEREFQRLGGTRLQKANIRVIAATNRDLRKAVERGDFREDLFYRLGVFDIPIPPLRERPSDIVPLSETFLQEIGRSFGRPAAGLTREARQALLQYPWPGNVRELRNVLERAAILCEGALIDAEHLALQPAARPSRNDTTDLSALERTTIAKVLQEYRGNKTKAARRLGLSRTQLHLRVRKYRTRASCHRVIAKPCRVMWR